MRIFRSFAVLAIHALTYCHVVQNKMTSDALSIRSLANAKAAISDFLVANFVKDMRETIDEMVNTKGPLFNQSGDDQKAGYLSAQMSIKDANDLQRKKEWRGRIKNILSRKDRKVSESELFVKKLAPIAHDIQMKEISPMLIFINRKSGGRTGSTLLERLKPSFPTAQVCDLSKHLASDYLKLYSNCSDLRILICGGDGTVGWIMDETKKVFPVHNHAFGIVPLGTGNDLCIQLKGVPKSSSFGDSYTGVKHKSNAMQNTENEKQFFKTPQNTIEENSFFVEENVPQEREVTNLLPHMVISDPSKLNDWYQSPKILQLDRWCVKVQRVHGRKRKLLKLLLIQNRVKRRGNRFLSGFSRWIFNLWRSGNQKMKERNRLKKKLISNETSDSASVLKTSVTSTISTTLISISNLNSDSNFNSTSTSTLLSTSITNTTSSDEILPVNIKEADPGPEKKQIPKAKRAEGTSKDEPMKYTMNNYLGVGVDGAVTLGFHSLRQKVPALFFSRWINKIWYGMISLRTFLLGWSRDLSLCCQLVCDGRVIIIPPGTQSIIMLNINSYAGGMKMWPDITASYTLGTVTVTVNWTLLHDFSPYTFISSYLISFHLNKMRNLTII